MQTGHFWRDQDSPTATAAADIGAYAPAGRQLTPREDREITVEEPQALVSVKTGLFEAAPLKAEARNCFFVDV
jgi:hypothetical protein